MPCDIKVKKKSTGRQKTLFECGFTIVKKQTSVEESPNPDAPNTVTAPETEIPSTPSTPTPDLDSKPQVDSLTTTTMSSNHCYSRKDKEVDLSGIDIDQIRKELHREDREMERAGRLAGWNFRY